MPNIRIGNTVIPFPNSASDSNWSPAIIEFAELVASALNASSAPFEIPHLVQTLSLNVEINLPLLVGSTPVVFPRANVTSFRFYYTVYRVSTGIGATSQFETGTITGSFDTKVGTWVLQQEWNGDKQADGTSFYTFTMGGIGGDQILFSSVAIPSGTYDNVNSRISFSGTSELVVNP